MLTVNFGVIHTTSVAFHHIVNYLTSYLEYSQPLLADVEAVVRQEGWSKAALNKMRKVDSFEQLRRSLQCKAMKDFVALMGRSSPTGRSSLHACAQLTL
ncbi:uncharacterized protein B0H18DRAFT_1036667 [Fomitopsis serialis]|uniref:uncharacterized protein n=1 Tax=Fomitopsis serialis TaxID=139415 RepID=UPI0020078C72|nr:uncharacterized protein B0H18DRAFT_1036667 [Neoantrodia serialis]KAH9916864.1 hypothetical protein B0H18DRAFT_1036667 [Neoantrodia serialis]